MDAWGLDRKNFFGIQMKRKTPTIFWRLAEEYSQTLARGAGRILLLGHGKRGWTYPLMSFQHPWASPQLLDTNIGFGILSSLQCHMLVQRWRLLMASIWPNGMHCYSLPIVRINIGSNCIVCLIVWLVGDIRCAPLIYACTENCDAVGLKNKEVTAGAARLLCCIYSSLGRYVFGSEISYNKAPPRLPGLGC